MADQTKVQLAPEGKESGEQWRVKANEYTYIFFCNGQSKALRNGEDWRDTTGDGLILALAGALFDCTEVS